MNAEIASRLLDRGIRLGFRKPTDDPDYLGWILIDKREPNLRLLEILTMDDSPKLVSEELRNAREPYAVRRIELDRRVHEAGHYESNGDYRQNEELRFETFEDAVQQLHSWGFSIDDAEDSRDLDAP